MKKFLGIMLVLCVVAPATFGAYLDEYTWTGTAGNFTDATWTVKTNDPAGASSRPAVPFESANTTDWTNYARPQVIGATSVLTINTDLAPLNVGFAQFQLDKGRVIVDNGGKLRIGNGYMTAGQKSTTYADNFGLVVQNGGQYVNTAIMTSASDTQKGTLLTYTTANSYGHVTVTGAGSLFDSRFVFGGRAGQTQTRNAMFEVLGSGSTINVGTFGPGGNNLTMTYKFTTDAQGVAAINIDTLLAFRQGVNATHVTNASKLDLVLGAAAPAQILLFDLTANATRTGVLKTNNAVSTDLTEGTVFSVYNADKSVIAWYSISYVGGDTLNDVVLTAVPEPATLGLLSLGGLLLARRRRA